MRLVTRTNSSTRSHLSNLEKLLQKQSQDLAVQPNPVVSSDAAATAGGNNTLHGALNLARIWPETKAAEEMSPRNLNRLQRLLSMTPQYSPRTDLGSRWREYHGSRDWAGMLDPLDPNLRWEVVKYGECTQASYHSPLRPSRIVRPSD